MNYCGFNIEPFCSEMCGDHWRPQTLAEICRNMGICCGFRALAARGKYPGFILFRRNLCQNLLAHCNGSLHNEIWLYPSNLETYWGNIFWWCKIWNHWQLHNLFNRLFKLTQKISKLHVTGPFCEDYTQVTSGFSLQRLRNLCGGMWGFPS